MMAKANRDPLIETLGPWLLKAAALAAGALLLTPVLITLLTPLYQNLHSLG